MRVVPDDYISYQYDASKEPIQVVEIEFDTNELVYLTSHAGVDLPVGETAVQGCLSKITSTSQTINPSQGRSTIGSIRFSALDLNGAITSILKTRDDAGDGFRHKTCRVYQAFAGMTWGQISANQVQTQIIIGLSEDKGIYNFQLADVQRSARKNIFTKAKSRLSASITATDMLIPVLTTTGHETLLHDASFTDAPSARVGYLLIDDEAVRYTGTVVDNTVGLSFVVDERGALNTIAAAHEVDPADTSDRATYAEEFVYLEMPAPKLIYALLTGKLEGQGTEVLPSNWHLGIDPSFVRLSDFTGAGTDLWDTANGTGFILRFAGEKEQDGKQFIEQQICLLLSAFMPVYSSGELGFKLATSVLYNASHVAELDKTNVKDFSAITFDADQVHNILSVEWNYDFIRDKLTRQRIVADNTSRAKYGDAPVKSLKFRGLHGSRHTSQFVESVFDRLRDRFAAPPATMTIKALPYMNTLEVGDVVRVGLKGKDFFGGGDLDRAMEIQSVKVDWTTGDLSFKLFGSSQSAGLIAPIDPGNTYDPRYSILSGAFYAPVSGTDLASYAGVTINVVGSVGHITGGSGLVGGDFQSQGIFYYDGDLEIDAGVILTFSKNVQLRVNGNLQINGELNGTGLGYAGAAQTTDNPPLLSSRNNGTNGFLSQSIYGGGVLIRVLDNVVDNLFTRPIALRGNNYRGFTSVAPQISLNYDDSNDTLTGIPNNLIGTSGSSGGNYASSYPNELGSSHLAGGAGGASGAGLSIIARGVSFGASGKIVSNGLPGSIGEQTPDTGPTTRWQAGTGGGGACGAVYIVIDGLLNNVPDLNKVELIYGSMPYAPAVPMPTFITANNPPTITVGLHTGYGLNPPDLSGFNGGARVVFVPPLDQPEEDLLIAQPLTEVEWEDVQNTAGNRPANNATVGATWGGDIASQPSDPELLNYLVPSGVFNKTDWPATDGSFYMPCYVNNNQASDGWFKVSELTLTGTYRSVGLQGMFQWGASSRRFSASSRVEAALAVGSPETAYSSSSFKFSGPDLSSRLRISRSVESGTNRHTFHVYVYLTAWASALCDFVWSTNSLLSTGSSWIDDEQNQDDSLGASDPRVSHTELTPTANYDLGATVGSPTGTPVGGTPAETVESNAANALSSAASALITLGEIASDSLLTPVEKPQVIANRDVIIAEQTGIDAQATAYSITTEKTAYDAAVTALTGYLATLTSPVLWSDLSGNTTIVSATFSSRFNDVYTTKQTLLNKIVEVVTAENPQGAAWLTDQVVGDHNQVTTGNIDDYVTDNSISNGDFIETFGSNVFVSRLFSETQILNITGVNTSGGEVAIDFGGRFIGQNSISSGSDVFGHVVIKRIQGGTAVTVGTIADILLADASGTWGVADTLYSPSFSGRLRDSPPAGNYQYRMSANTTGNGSTNVFDAYLDVEEKTK